MEVFLDWSGWFFGLAGFIFGLVQLVQKQGLKKEINKNRSKQENYSADNGGFAVRENRGGINIKR